MGHNHSKAGSTFDDDAPPPYSSSDSKLQVPQAGKSDSRSSSTLSLGLKFGRKSGESDRSLSPTPPSEDALAMLRKYEVCILVDDSRSMADDNMRSWFEARDALAALAGIAGRYDSDGLDLSFLNTVHKDTTGLRDEKTVLELFDSITPFSGTPIGERLDALLRRYLRKLEAAKTDEERDKIKPLDVIVITDGEPTDDPEAVIVDFARRLDAGNYPLNQAGVQFVQVGKDSSATRYLKRLDSKLTKEHNIRDMVDTTPASKLHGKLSATALIKILLGAVNRRVDNEKMRKR